MSISRHFLSLHPLEGFRHLALEQWNAALRKQGHEVEERPLRRPNESPKETGDTLAAWIVRHRPAALFTASALSFTAPEFFHRPEVAAVPTAAFWFDDPYRPVERWARQPGFLDVLRLPTVHHFVWDGHWRQWLQETYSIASRPIHLAADPELFRPLPTPPEHAGDALFIGTLVSARNLASHLEKLPPVLLKAARQAEAAIRESPYGANPFALLETVLAALPARLRAEADALRERDPDTLLTLHGLVWKWGKNEVRRRMLRAALEAAPVVLFCGNIEKTQAEAGELTALFAGAAHPLLFRDTSHLDGRNLASLYAHGAVHLQATDPQSVAGGIPFRVFQTTACGKTLFTDVKPELLECYREGEEIACYRSEAEIAPGLLHLLKNKSERERIAEAGHRRFQAEHRWDQRIAVILKTLGIV